MALWLSLSTPGKSANKYPRWFRKGQREAWLNITAGRVRNREKRLSIWLGLGKFKYWWPLTWQGGGWMSKGSMQSSTTMPPKISVNLCTGQDVLAEPAWKERPLLCWLLRTRVFSMIWGLSCRGTSSQCLRIWKSTRRRWWDLEEWCKSRGQNKLSIPID